LRSLTVRGKASPEIREARLTDLDEMYRIEVECFSENAFSYSHLEYCLRSSSFINLIALINDEAAGFIIGLLEESNGRFVGHVLTLDVKRKYRRMGVGSSLLKALERVFIKEGAAKTILEARIDNVSAERLYLKHGYVPKGIIRDYYGPGLDAVRFERDLGKNSAIHVSSLE